jgi:hypothetical protein
MLECIAAFVALNTLPIVFPLALRNKEMNSGNNNKQSSSSSQTTATSGRDVERFSLDDESSSFDEEQEDQNDAASFSFDEIPFLGTWLLCGGANPGRQVYEE